MSTADGVLLVRTLNQIFMLVCLPGRKEFCGQHAQCMLDRVLDMTSYARIGYFTGERERHCWQHASSPHLHQPRPSTHNAMIASQGRTWSATRRFCRALPLQSRRRVARRPSAMCHWWVVWMQTWDVYISDLKSESNKVISSGVIRACQQGCQGRHITYAYQQGHH